MKFIFTKKSAKKLARTLEKYLQAHGIELSHGQALDALATMQGEKDGNALMASISREAVDAGLNPIEREHIASSADDRYGEECEMRVHTGFALRYSATSEACDYVRVVDPFGRETMYWHYEEWEQDPQLVMGAILWALVRERPILPRQGDESRDEADPTGSIEKPPAAALSQPLTIYTECHCTNEWGDVPAWARLTIDSGLLAEIQKLAKTVKDLGLVRLSKWGDPDCWAGQIDEDNWFRVECGKLEVEDDRFWYSAIPKHTDYYIETDSIDIRGLVKVIEGPTECSEMHYERRGQVLIYVSDSSREDFIEQLLEDGEEIPEKVKKD